MQFTLFCSVLIVIVCAGTSRSEDAEVIHDPSENVTMSSDHLATAEAASPSNKSLKYGQRKRKNMKSKVIVKDEQNVEIKDLEEKQNLKTNETEGNTSKSDPNLVLGTSPDNVLGINVTNTTNSTNNEFANNYMAACPSFFRFANVSKRMLRKIIRMQNTNGEISRMLRGLLKSYATMTNCVAKLFSEIGLWLKPMMQMIPEKTLQPLNESDGTHHPKIPLRTNVTKRMNATRHVMSKEHANSIRVKTVPQSSKIQNRYVDNDQPVAVP